MLWTAHMWMLAQFPSRAQEELWSNPNMLASSVVNTMGDVVPVDGGYRWTGRGFFSSGVDHCNWLTAAVPIKRPRRGRSARPALAADSARGLRHRRRLVYRRAEGHRQQDDCRRTTSSFPSDRTIVRKDVEEGVAPGQRSTPTRCMARPHGPTSPPRWPRRPWASARGFLARVRGPPALEVQHVDDGLTVNMSRFAQAAAMVDAAHALTLQNASVMRASRRRSRSRRTREVSPRPGIHRADRPQSRQHPVRRMRRQRPV